MSDQEQNERPDLGEGIPIEDLPAGEPTFGHVDGDPVYVIRVGDEVRAFSAGCTHYGAPLADGLLVEGTLRCPWHHARFSVEDGRVLGGPAFDPLQGRKVEVSGGTVVVGQEEERDPLAPEATPASSPDSVVIVGAGPGGTTAAETLRREGYTGPIALVDPDGDAPYDRPNLSKAYLAGEAEDAWLPLRSTEFFREHGIDRIEARVASLDLEARSAALDDGRSLPFGALLLAPGSRPRNLAIEGAESPHVFTLRTLADSRSIIEASDDAQTAVVVGASFIGMEVAASLRQRGIDVTVVAPESVPFEATLGRALGSSLQALHEEEGVTFRLGRGVEAIGDTSVRLDDGQEIPGQLVVVGVGVTPSTDLAERAGLETDDGILVDGRLRTSHEAVWAAGDVARYPDPRTGERIRIEHWVVAGRQGRTAARNMLGRDEPFTDAPFFWTRQFGRSVAYVGHAVDWDETEVAGDCAAADCAVSYMRGGRRLALATVGRSEESLEAEISMETDPAD